LMRISATGMYSQLHESSARFWISPSMQESLGSQNPLPTVTLMDDCSPVYVLSNEMVVVQLSVEFLAWNQICL
jgi:hypothetical protein